MCMPAKQTTTTAETAMRKLDICLIYYLISVAFRNVKSSYISPDTFSVEGYKTLCELKMDLTDISTFFSA